MSQILDHDLFNKMLAPFRIACENPFDNQHFEGISLSVIKKLAEDGYITENCTMCFMPTFNELLDFAARYPFVTFNGNTTGIGPDCMVINAIQGNYSTAADREKFLEDFHQICIDADYSMSSCEENSFYAWWD